ncbi:MAG TPA: aminoacyl-tRNA hydrolase [Candidatus Hydrogenedentes bacterium]|nr:aminoacyl-tRNA hydrolase [Candidatus Hydrogenedentota bacterium]
MKAIVGLGNPGPQYNRTRHNVGYMVLDCLAERLGVSFEREKYQGLIIQTKGWGKEIMLVKPLTWMNRSGICVAQVARNRITDPADVFVVADDVNLPLGRLRVRRQGSAGGHNGLKSIIEHLGTDEFPRLRVGIGEDSTQKDLTNHVLGRFKPEEWATVEEMVDRAADVVVLCLTEGLEQAMNTYN